MSKKQVFKAYHQHQLMLLPPNLEELIPGNHLVRIVNRVVDKLDLCLLVSCYEGGGTSAYHPVMLVKVVIYAYASKIYTARKIAKALREDINFMWLSGGNRPDFRTINNFRSGRLKPLIDRLFGSFLKMLIDEGYVRIEHYCVDGTKMRAAVGKHSYVWKKNAKRYKESTEEKIRELLHYIEESNKAEDQSYGDKDLEELGDGKDIDGEELGRKIQELKETIEERFKETGDTSELRNCRQAIREIEKKHIPKLAHYTNQLSILGSRNSYSKTDHDATFYKTKDGRLMPGYNVQLGTENQFILNYSIHQNPADNVHLKSHMERFHRLSGRYPKDIIGDSAYGNEENYAFIKEQGIGNYLKYPSFHQEQSRARTNNPVDRSGFTYDSSRDEYVCPGTRRLIFKEVRHEATSTGYHQKVRIYECHDCSGCVFAAQCIKGKGHKRIHINPTLENYRQEAYENLTSAKGIQYRKQRNVDVEPVFGHMKWNRGFQRFLLRGVPKVNVEVGLMSFAHNIKKMAAAIHPIAKKSDQKIASGLKIIKNIFIRIGRLSFLMPELGF